MADRVLDLPVVMEHAYLVVRALMEAIEHAELPTPRMQRTLATPARGGDGRSYTVEVVLRVETDEHGYG